MEEHVIKEKYWQKVMALALVAHILQCIIMGVLGYTSNPVLSIGMIIIALSWLYRFSTSSSKDFSKQ